MFCSFHLVCTREVGSKRLVANDSIVVSFYAQIYLQNCSDECHAEVELFRQNAVDYCLSESNEFIWMKRVTLLYMLPIEMKSILLSTVYM